MSLTWYLQRLRQMSLGEGVVRGRDFARQTLWRRRQVASAQDDSLDLSNASPAFVSRIAPNATRAVRTAAQDRVILAADELLEGKWPVFETLRTDMAPAPDWFWDPKTNRRAPSDRYCFRIPHRDEGEVGNIKYVWELSRHQHLTVLAAAYHATGNERYAEAIEWQLESWWRYNPFLSGVHWTSGIEVGVRLISWVWIRRLIDGWSGAGDLFERNASFLKQLHHHQLYLDRFSSHGSSANNHVLAEAAGQFVAARAFPCFIESEKWGERAALRLEREIPRQAFPSGLHRELATDYHGFVVELCLVAALEGEASGRSLGVSVWKTLCRMVDALAAIVDTTGQPPRQGDGDDGRGFLFDAPDFDRWAAILATGEALFGALPWWPKVEGSDVQTSLLASMGRPPAISTNRPARRPALLDEAGMVIFRSGDGHDEVWCRLDHGPHGYLSIAAHAHADALSMELRAGGVTILADPGTYCYHGEPEWRDYFRSTRAHNTLEVGGRDQSVSAGPFLWTRRAGSRLISVEGLEDESEAVWCAQHDGYTYLNLPVVHRRTVRFDRPKRTLAVEDHVTCQGQHEYRLFYHLGPDIECELNGGLARLSWDSPMGRREAQLILPPELTWQSVRGAEAPPMGWFSAGFDRRVPSTTLSGTATIPGDFLLTTQIEIASTLRAPSSTYGDTLVKSHDDD